VTYIARNPSDELREVEANMKLPDTPVKQTFRVHSGIWIEVKAKNEKLALELAQKLLSRILDESELMDWEYDDDGRLQPTVIANCYCGTLDTSTVCEHIEED
jgi:hypothetical protein